MSLDALIMFVGALVAVLPFLGLPITWRLWIIFILGLIVIALGIAVRRRGDRRQRARRRRGEFIESVPVESMRRPTPLEEDSING